MQFEQTKKAYANSIYDRCLQFELDNAAKIFPSTIGKKQHHIYRLSMTLNEKIDEKCLQSALSITIHRFPTIAARLRKGIFWYRLESIKQAPDVQPENLRLMEGMSELELKKCCFRTLYGKNAIIVEFFHALCDGSGAMVFLKSLVAEYLEQKHKVRIPCEFGVMDRRDSPMMRELEDCYPKHAGPKAAKRALTKAHPLSGTVEKDGKLHVLQITLDIEKTLACAKKRGVSLTEFLTSSLIAAIADIQKATVKENRRKPILIAVPVNLRKFFDCSTLRNFSLCVTPGIDPQQGEWAFDEICDRIHHQMATMVTRKEMEACVAANVRIERIAAFRLMPLFIKNALMKGAYSFYGANNCCLSLSNLGAIQLPNEMQQYMSEIDCCMDTNSRSTNSCAVLTYNGQLRISFCRSIQETGLEQRFLDILRNLGLEATTREYGWLFT